MLPMLGLGALGGAGAAGLPAMLGGGGLGTLATAGLLGGSLLGLSGDPRLRQAGAVGQTLSLAPFLFGVGAPIRDNPLTTTQAGNNIPGIMAPPMTMGNPPMARVFGPMM